MMQVLDAYRFEAVRFRDTARPDAPVLIAIPASQADASNGERAQWLPVAPHQVDSRTGLDAAEARRWAGIEAVVEAIATAGWRERRPTATEDERRSAARLASTIERLHTSVPDHMDLAISARSPRSTPPPGASLEDRRMGLRIHGDDGPIVIRCGWGRADGTVVMDEGRRFDIALPGFNETARRLTGGTAGFRPKANAARTLGNIARRGDATQFRIKVEQDSTSSEELVTQEELHHRVLATSWPLATPNNAETAWWIPITIGEKGEAEATGETTMRLERAHNALRIGNVRMRTSTSDAMAMDTLVQALLQTARKRAIQWTNRKTARVIDITARPRMSR